MPEFHVIGSGGLCFVAELVSTERDGEIVVLSVEGRAAGGSGRICDIHDWTAQTDEDDFRGVDDVDAWESPNPRFITGVDFASDA